MWNTSRGAQVRSPSTTAEHCTFHLPANLLSQDRFCSIVTLLQMQSPIPRIRILPHMHFPWYGGILSVGPIMTQDPASSLRIGQQVTPLFLLHKRERITDQDQSCSWIGNSLVNGENSLNLTQDRFFNQFSIHHNEPCVCFFKCLQYFTGMFDICRIWSEDLVQE